MSKAKKKKAIICCPLSPKLGNGFRNASPKDSLEFKVLHVSLKTKGWVY